MKTKNAANKVHQQAACCRKATGRRCTSFLDMLWYRL